MIKLFEGADRVRQRHLFDLMHRQRKIVFRDNKGWDVPVVDGQFEIDEYDREDTVYLLAFDIAGHLVGSTRLLSTASSHMLTGPFRPMFPEASFCSPTIWEVTRFVVLGDHSLQPNGVSTAACELLLAMCRFGLDNGLTQMVAVYDAPMSRLYRRCGLNTTTVGRYKTEMHGTVAVGLGDINPSLELSILQATGLESSPAQHLAMRAA